MSAPPSLINIYLDYGALSARARCSALWAILAFNILRLGDRRPMLWNRIASILVTLVNPIGSTRALFHAGLESRSAEPG
jgi:hypothetical protein